ncbi:MAG TPA: hypothetical protein VFR14_09975 [Candidatus Limnocylindrales bacterium]|nr:hypothetical protein [Candidatus Limnocylindrales bacterium]
MDGRRMLMRLALAVALGGAGCGTAAAPTPTPLPAARNGAEFSAAWCASMQAMFRAIGNPDTASDSELSAALDEAITNADYSAVERFAAMIQAEIATGRQHAESASAWGPGATMAGHLDRLLVAFGVMVEERRASARDGLSLVDQRAQAAFEAAGGVESWFAMLEAARALPPDVVTLLGTCRFEGGPAAS